MWMHFYNDDTFCNFSLQLWPLFGGRLTKPAARELFYIPQVRVSVTQGFSGSVGNHCIPFKWQFIFSCLDNIMEICYNVY